MTITPDKATMAEIEAWGELADELDRCLNQLLSYDVTANHFVKAELAEHLWDNKGGIIRALRVAALAIQPEAEQGWQPIETYDGPNRQEVDLWLDIHASPRSMGMSDAFRVTDAYRVNGKWFHRQNGQEKELFADYITHYRPLPAPPPAEGGQKG